MLSDITSFLQIDPTDNVLVALKDLCKGTVIYHQNILIELKSDIPSKHKFFLADLKSGEDIYMYGLLVGKATQTIEKGSLMTTSNVKHASGKYSYRAASYKWQPPDTSMFQNRQFLGYKRSDGRVGTANYWIFIPTVFCENRNLDVIKDCLQNALGYAVTGKYRLYAEQLVEAYTNHKDIDSLKIVLSLPNLSARRVFKNIDGIKFLNHQGGCGGTREDAATLSRLLSAYADHPNVAGITLLSLGCQNLQIQNFIDDLKNRNPYFDKPLLVFEQQRTISEELLIKEAITETFKCLIKADRIEREPAALSKLVLGVKCGGSDGFSGISANPAVGYAADLLVALGGKVLLAEFPELCGVEQNIIDRCVSKTAAEKFIRLMTTYSEQAKMVKSGFHMNPSPGNIKDGLITDAIKSAGAAKKGGTSPVTDVLDYTETANSPGLNLVCTPGNDVEATTGQAASGATLILFTTGLGTPTGNPVCPTIKVSSNSLLAGKMNDIIDIDSGPVITGEKTIQQMGKEILEYCIKAASGEIVPKAVLLGQDDFIPWKRGISL